MSSSIFCDITLCSAMKVSRRIGGTCRLHLHGRRISYYTTVKAGGRHRSGMLLGSFLYSEDGGVVLLLNVGWPSTDYVALKLQIRCNLLHTTDLEKVSNTIKGLGGAIRQRSMQGCCLLNVWLEWSWGGGGGVDDRKPKSRAAATVWRPPT
jgi:hypothetical protein